MSRMENTAVMCFYTIEPKHHAAILSVVQAATPEHKQQKEKRQLKLASRYRQ